MLTLVLTRHGLTDRSRPEQHLGHKIYISINDAGRRYSAGAPANAFCFDPRGPEYCRGAAADRSGTVLELLTGILAYNQSEEAVRTPQSSVLQTR